MKEKKVDYESLFHLADETIKEIFGLFDGKVSLSPEELYELSQIRERYNGSIQKDGF